MIGRPTNGTHIWTGTRCDKEKTLLLHRLTHSLHNRVPDGLIHALQAIHNVVNQVVLILELHGESTDLCKKASDGPMGLLRVVFDLLGQPTLVLHQGFHTIILFRHSLASLLLLRCLKKTTLLLRLTRLSFRLTRLLLRLRAKAKGLFLRLFLGFQSLEFLFRNANDLVWLTRRQQMPTTTLCKIVPSVASTERLRKNLELREDHIPASRVWTRFRPVDGDRLWIRSHRRHLLLDDLRIGLAGDQRWGFFRRRRQ